MEPLDSQQILAMYDPVSYTHLFKNGTSMNAKFVGRSAKYIADAAGVAVPDGTKVLLGKQDGVGPALSLIHI